MSLKCKAAQEVLEILAQGINPDTGEVFPTESIVQTPHAKNILKVIAYEISMLEQESEDSSDSPTSSIIVSSDEVQNSEASLTDINDNDLFQLLRSWRLNKARELGWTAAYVFHNSVLRAISQEKPLTIQALNNIKGVGEKKTERFGDELLEIINNYSMSEDAGLSQNSTHKDECEGSNGGNNEDVSDPEGSNTDVILQITEFVHAKQEAISTREKVGEQSEKWRRILDVVKSIKLYGFLEPGEFENKCEQLINIEIPNKRVISISNDEVDLWGQFLALYDVLEEYELELYDFEDVKTIGEKESSINRLNQLSKRFNEITNEDWITKKQINVKIKELSEKDGLIDDDANRHSMNKRSLERIKGHKCKKCDSDMYIAKEKWVCRKDDCYASFFLSDKEREFIETGNRELLA